MLYVIENQNMKLRKCAFRYEGVRADTQACEGTEGYLPVRYNKKMLFWRKGDQFGNSVLTLDEKSFTTPILKTSIPRILPTTNTLPPGSLTT